MCSEKTDQKFLSGLFSPKDALCRVITDHSDSLVSEPDKDSCFVGSLPRLPALVPVIFIVNEILGY